MEKLIRTKKVFWENPYLAELTAKITSIHGDTVTVDQTIFYAFSGGQESDAGMIGECEVVEARTEGDDIRYTLKNTTGLKIGDSVIMTIDWERRYRLMRLHFATEIVLELIYKSLPGIKKIGAHIAQDKARIDFEYDGSLADILDNIEREANKIIEDNKEIKSYFSDEEKGRRYWEIAGFAKVPCGGTHLKKTGEIGGVELKRKTLGSGKERIGISLINPV